MLVELLEKQLHQLESGAVKDSLQELKRLLKHPQMTVELQFEVAESLYRLGFLDEALQMMESLQEQYPDEPELLITLAEMYGEAERTEEAIALLSQIGPEQEDYLRSVLLSAEMYMLDGLYEVAEQKLKAALADFPDQPILRQALGEVFYQREEYAFALENFKQGVEPPKDKLAHCYAHTGEFEEALDHYEAAIAEEDHPDLYFGHGFMAYQLQRWPEAVDSLAQVIEADPHYTSVYPLLVEAHLHVGDREEALGVLNEGLKYDETNPRLFELKAQFHRQAGEMELAKQQLNKALDMEPQNLSILEELYRLCREENDDEQALFYLQQLSELAPDRGDYHLEQGEIYEELEKWDQAESSYRAALEADPENTEVLNRLAFFLRDEGHVHEAVSLWKQSVRLDPDQWDLQHLILEYETESSS